MKSQSWISGICEADTQVFEKRVVKLGNSGSKGLNPRSSATDRGPTPRTSGQTAPLTSGSEGDSPRSCPGLLPFPFSLLRVAERLQLKAVPAHSLPLPFLVSASLPTTTRVSSRSPSPSSSQFQDGDRAGARRRGRSACPKWAGPRKRQPRPSLLTASARDGQPLSQSARAPRHADLG